MFNEEQTERFSIFKCVNGYGIEVITSQGGSAVSDDDESKFLVKGYVATNLAQVIEMLRANFEE